MALYAFSAIDRFVYGYQRQTLEGPAGQTGSQESAEAFLAVVPAGQFPYLVELITDYVLTAGYDENAAFEFGLDLILDGLERVRASGTQ